MSDGAGKRREQADIVMFDRGDDGIATVEPNPGPRFIPHMIRNVGPDMRKDVGHGWIIRTIYVVLILIVVRNQLESHEKRHE